MDKIEIVPYIEIDGVRITMDDLKKISKIGLFNG